MLLLLKKSDSPMPLSQFKFLLLIKDKLSTSQGWYTLRKIKETKGIIKLQKISGNFQVTKNLRNAQGSFKIKKSQENFFQIQKEIQLIKFQYMFKKIILFIFKCLFRIFQPCSQFLNFFKGLKNSGKFRLLSEVSSHSGKNFRLKE